MLKNPPSPPLHAAMHAACLLVTTVFTEDAFFLLHPILVSRWLCVCEHGSYYGTWLQNTIIPHHANILHKYTPSPCAASSNQVCWCMIIHWYPTHPPTDLSKFAFTFFLGTIGLALIILGLFSCCCCFLRRTLLLPHVLTLLCVDAAVHRSSRKNISALKAPKKLALLKPNFFWHF